MIETGIAKLRYAIATQGRTLQRLGVLLVLVGLLGGGVSFAYPPTETVTEITDRSVVETESSSFAVVAGDHEFYREGETLTDEAVYLLEVTPAVALTTTTRAPEGVRVEQRLELVYEASSSSEGVFRERREVVSTTTETVTTQDGAVEMGETLQMDEVAATLAAMREEIGDAGDVTVYLAVETKYEADGYAGTLTDQRRLVVTKDSYQIPALSASAVHGPTTTRERPVADKVVEGTLPSVGHVVVPHLSGAFLLLALVGGVVVVVVRRGRGRIDPERERARIHRRRYGEWISVGELPATPTDWAPVVSVESLEALVDFAIDSKTRVIYDESQGCYAVITAGITYVYVASEPPC